MRVPFADLVLSLESGKRPKGGVGTVESGVLSLGGEHISPNGTVNLSKPRFIPIEFYESLRKGKILPNDILIVKDGATTGRVALVPDLFSSQAAANEHIFIVRTDERKILQQFAFHFLRSTAGQAAIMSDFRGAAQGGIGRTFIDKISIPLPPLAEQRRIVGILNRAAKIERLRAQARERLGEFIPALFNKMFGDPATNPMGWETAHLGGICTIVGGGTPRRNNPSYFGGSIPWATPTDITALPGCPVISTTKETITETGLLESSARLVPARTVLLTSRATIGYTAVADVPMATNQGFANLTCGDRLLPEYLAPWLRLRRDYLIQLAGGTTFKEISKATLKQVEIPLPPLAEQRRFARIVDRARAMGALAENGSATASALSASLMSRLLI